jgi:plasmid stabilization system protein ParE
VTELTWSPRSVADLEEIRTFIEADSPAWADLTVRRVVAAVERLQQFPDSGRMVPERHSPDLREVISGNFRIVYRRRTTTVEIATVFRWSRDFSALTDSHSV